MQWVGGNSAPRVVGHETATGQVNYLIGKDSAHWYTGVQTYAKVAYESVYPGGDLVYYGNQGQLEYDVVVAPKADPKTIRLAFRGADRIEVNAAGELVLHSGNPEIQMHKPVIYQEISGIRKSIGGGYCEQEKALIASTTIFKCKPLQISVFFSLKKCEKTHI
jgi:hypothetical protein